MYNPQLETFLKVADAGSFNKAAELSYITPTAVIKQINLLEADLEVKLFERTHRGLKLTKAGISLYNDTKYIIQYCRDSVIRARNSMQEDVNIIRIGTSPMTPAGVLVELWPKIHELCPEIKFQLIPFENTPENAREILKNLGQNIDVVAGIFDETMLNVRNCAGFEISRQPLCCAVSIHHRLADKNKLQVEDLYGENLMLMNRDWSRYVDRLRDDIWKNHNQINIVDFDFYNVEVFNRCENSNDISLAAVISARRAGTTATFDQLNKYFTIQEMPIVSSRYWNMVHGATAEQVKQDAEGLYTMRVLGRNMAYMLRCQEAARNAGVKLPEREEPIFTNFIR